MAEPTAGPLEYQKEKPLSDRLMDLLHAAADPDAIMFVTRAGTPACLMRKGFHCWHVPSVDIKVLVKRAYIDQATTTQNKVACMGWIQYTVTYAGQQAINKRHG